MEKLLRPTDAFSVHHLRAICPGNTPDTVWLPQLGQDIDAFLLTVDIIYKTPQEKKALKQAGLVSFFLKNWDQGLWPQSGRVILHWDTIAEKARAAARGDCFNVYTNGRIDPYAI